MLIFKVFKKTLNKLELVVKKDRIFEIKSACQNIRLIGAIYCINMWSKGTSIKDVLFFQDYLDPPTIRYPTLSRFHIPTPKRTSQFDNTPHPIFFYWYNDNICRLEFFLYNFFLNYYSQNQPAILKPISVNHTQNFLLISHRAEKEE